jgi:predicted DNA-binding protein with PD1-like motif
MKSQRIAEEGRGETLIVVLDDGEEAFSALQEFARREGVSAASLTAIGAFSRASVGWFDFSSKSYKEIAVDQKCEVLSAIGDDGKASLHVHIVLGLSDRSMRGGHLLKGTVHPTLEVVLTETPARLRRRRRPELGIALIDADSQQNSRD